TAAGATRRARTAAGSGATPTAWSPRRAPPIPPPSEARSRSWLKQALYRPWATTRHLPRLLRCGQRPSAQPDRTIRPRSAPVGCAFVETTTYAGRLRRAVVEALRIGFSAPWLRALQDRQSSRWTWLWCPFAGTRISALPGRRPRFRNVSVHVSFD